MGRQTRAVHRRNAYPDQPDSVITFLAWLGCQKWSVWIKIQSFIILLTTLVVIVTVVAGPHIVHQILTYLASLLG